MLYLENCFDTVGFPRNTLCSHNLAYKNTSQRLHQATSQSTNGSDESLETASELVVIPMVRATDFLS